MSSTVTLLLNDDLISSGNVVASPLDSVDNAARRLGSPSVDAFDVQTSLVTAKAVDSTAPEAVGNNNNSSNNEASSPALYTKVSVADDSGYNLNDVNSSSGLMCRICHCEETSEEFLITPCYCSGTLRFVHQSCLQQWLKSNGMKSCELCKFDFIMQTKIRSFKNWEKLDMNNIERRKVLCAVTFHIIAITCVIWSLYVLIERTADEIKNNSLDWAFWIKLIVVAIGFTGGVVFMYIQCKMYFQLCLRWRQYNRVIIIQPITEDYIKSSKKKFLQKQQQAAAAAAAAAANADESFALMNKIKGNKVKANEADNVSSFMSTNNNDSNSNNPDVVVLNLNPTSYVTSNNG